MRIALLLPVTAGHPLTKAMSRHRQSKGSSSTRPCGFDARYTAGREDRLLDFAAELADSRVDLIVVWSGAGARTAQHATRIIPIVFVSVTAPRRFGLVQSVFRPGGNITGVAFTSTEARWRSYPRRPAWHCSGRPIP